MTFEEWWVRLKPAEVDELKEVFIECWELAAATEREACAAICDDLDATEGGGYCGDARQCAAVIRDGLKRDVHPYTLGADDDEALAIHRAEQREKRKASNA